MPTVQLTQDNFEETIHGNGIVLVDFWASWCAPCRRFAAVFEESARQHPNVVFGKVDTEAEHELAGAFRIMSIPTLMIFRERVLVFAEAGVLPGDALEALIGRVEGLDMADIRECSAGADAE